MPNSEFNLAYLIAAAENIVERRRAICIPTNKRDRVRFLRQFPGIEVEVARQMEVSRSHVCKVVHRNSKSDRVWEALLAAIQKRLEALRQAQDDAKGSEPGRTAKQGEAT